MDIILDTHIWVWLVNGDGILKKSKSYKSILEAANTGTIYVSIISIWE